jgi:putative membrane protein
MPKAEATQIRTTVAPSWGHTVLRLVLHFVISVVLLLVILRLFPQLGEVNNLAGAIGVILILSILQTSIWPLFIRGFLGLFYKISPAFMFLAFPVVSLLLLTLFIMAGSWLSPNFVVHGFWSALLIALLFTVISLVFAGVFATDDESVIYQRTLKRIGRRMIKKEDVGKSGIIFLEIDGLGDQVLRDAMAKGKSPNMKRWIDCGSHRLVGWDSDLSSQTSAAQAGILHGNNFGIPAFRWYDKEQKRVVVSSSIKDVSQLEKKLSDGNGLLSHGGAARASLLSGDASRVLMTASRIFDVTSADLRSYYLNPSSLTRSLSLMVWDWVLEKKAAWSQRLRKEEPRLKRSGIYFILRSIMTVLLRDFSLFTLKGDMYAGVPYAYATLAGYDEVSHHSGIMRPDTLEVLRKLDREFGKLERIAADAPRRYQFVVLSDHGQTQGTTFTDRYHYNLESLVGDLLSKYGKNYAVGGYETRHESAYYIDAAFRDSGISRSGFGRQVENRLGNSQQIKIGKERNDDVVVLASGNLGLISFPFIGYRLTLEEIESMFPGLLDSLVKHPGIGFIMVHSSQKGPAVIGKQGISYIASGHIQGEDPLKDYDPTAPLTLLREDSFPNAPDILVISTYWKATDEVAAFEEQIGSHGGIGGPQSKPFILFPSEFGPVPEGIIGAEAVYRVFKCWIEKVVNSEE